MKKARIHLNLFQNEIFSLDESFQDTAEIKLERPESQPFNDPAKIPKLSRAESFPSNISDDTSTIISERSADFSFNLSENSEENTSLELFNVQGDVHSQSMKSIPACTSHIPEDHQTSSSHKPCSDEMVERVSTFNNPFESSEED